MSATSLVRPRRRSPVRPIVAVYGGLALLAIAGLALRDGGLASLVPPTAAKASEWVALGALAGALLAFPSYLARRWRPLRRIEAAVRVVFPELGPGEILALAVASGVAEELLFRALLQPAVGLLAASAIFGACHYAGRRFAAYPWSAAVAGLVLGGLFELTGAVLAPIVAHATVNGVGFARARRRRSARRRETRSTSGGGDAGGA